MSFRRRCVVIIADAKLKCECRLPFETVLHEQSPGALHDPVVGASDGYVEAIGLVLQKMRKVREAIAAIILQDVIVVEAPNFAAKCERVAPTYPMQCVIEGSRRVASALREIGLAADVPETGHHDYAHNNLRQADRGVDAVGDPEIGGIEELILRERDANTVVGRAGFVCEARSQKV